MFVCTGRKTQSGKLQALFLALSSLEIYLHLGGTEIIRNLEAFSNWCGVICGFVWFFFPEGKISSHVSSKKRFNPTHKFLQNNRVRRPVANCFLISLPSEIIFSQENRELIVMAVGFSHFPAPSSCNGYNVTKGKLEFCM